MCSCELLVTELLVSTKSLRCITDLYNPNKYSSRSASNTVVYQADDVSGAKKIQEFSLHHFQQPLATPSQNYQVHRGVHAGSTWEVNLCLWAQDVQWDSLVALQQWPDKSPEPWDWKHHLKCEVEINHIQKRHKKKKYERHRRTSVCRNIEQ